MKPSTSIRSAPVALIVLFAFLATAGLSAAETTPYGAVAAKETASSWSVADMLRYAIEDEYLARAEYVAVMARFGVVRPFSNIKAAEDEHILWIKDLYASRGSTLPADDAASRVPIPSSLIEAYKVGEQAEIDNITMYEAFLRSPPLLAKENADIRSTFERLMNASKNHLRTFRNQLGR